MTQGAEMRARLLETGYVAEETLAMALSLAVSLRRPLLLEGAAGVGKTEAARALATVLGTRLIRLQCYEGLDAAAAIYEWNYQRQLLSIKAREGAAESAEAIEAQIFSADYLLERPLLQAIRQTEAPVLLIDEVDRADEAFEAYLLEVLADFQVTVPEFGTITATSIPNVVLTSNGTRELSDALRRRCLYSYLDFPSQDQELAIILARYPAIEAELARQIAAFLAALRQEDLEKLPGMAETLDWTAALLGLQIDDLTADPEVLQPSLICLLKTEADLKAVTVEVTSRLAGQAA